jgi:DNA-binding transcriptional LysR family regulator
MAVELRHWRAFVAAADLQHFGRAAEQLGISQPALSQLVQALEVHLGSSLFDRSLRQVKLTPTGDAVLPEARATLEQARRAERVGSAIGRQGSRTLAGGYVGSAALHPIFGNLMQAIAAASPAIPLQLDQRPAVLQVRQLSEQVLDFGIAHTPLPDFDPEITSLLLARETMVLAIDSMRAERLKRPSRLSDFAQQPFIQYLQQPSGGLRALTARACQKAGFEQKVSHTVPQIATMLCLVAAGLGVALIPETARRLALPGVVYCPIADEISTDLRLLYRRSNTSPSLRALLHAARRLTHKKNLSK